MAWGNKIGLSVNTIRIIQIIIEGDPNFSSNMTVMNYLINKDIEYVNQSILPGISDGASFLKHLTSIFNFREGEKIKELCGQLLITPITHNLKHINVIDARGDGNCGFHSILMSIYECGLWDTLFGPEGADDTVKFLSPYERTGIGGDTTDNSRKGKPHDINDNIYEASILENKDSNVLYSFEFSIETVNKLRQILINNVDNILYVDNVLLENFNNQQYHAFIKRNLDSIKKEKKEHIEIDELVLIANSLKICIVMYDESLTAYPKAVWSIIYPCCDPNTGKPYTLSDCKKIIYLNHVHVHYRYFKPYNPDLYEVNYILEELNHIPFSVDDIKSFISQGGGGSKESSAEPAEPEEYTFF